MRREENVGQAPRRVQLSSLYLSVRSPQGRWVGEEKLLECNIRKQNANAECENEWWES